MREGYKDSALGEIPLEWEVVKLGDILKLSSGSGLSKSNLIEGEYPVYGGNGIAFHHNSYTHLQPKLIIGRVGAKCGCIHRTRANSWITDNALVIKILDLDLDSYFLEYILVEIDLNRFANKNAQPVISGGRIYPIEIKFPSLKEQKKIAEILTTVDEKIEVVEQQIKETKELKKGLMQKLLTKGINHNKFKDSPLGQIPDSWEVVKLGDVCGINKNTLNNNTPKDYSFKYLDLASVKCGMINIPVEYHKFETAPSRARRIIYGNDVLFATVRPNLLGYGIVNFDSDNVICSTGFAVLSEKDNTNNYFIYQNLYSICIQNQIETLIVGSNYPAINSSDVGNLKFPFPPLKEQTKIAGILITVDNKIDILEKKKSEIIDLKKGLMQQLLTGKTRVKLI